MPGRLEGGAVDPRGYLPDVLLPEGDRAIVDEGKVRHYLLSHAHPIGRFKAAFFLALGFREEAWEELCDALLAVARTGETTAGRPSEFGTKYEVRGILRAPGGRSATVVTVWMVSDGHVEPRLVTAFPG